jgi:Tol biopolymer transport system component
VLTCIYVRIDGVSGERVVVTAPDLEQYRGYDSSLSLSPDGTLMAYFDWMGSPLARRVLDFDAGTSAVVDSIDQYNSNTSWAADSSGLFIIENRRLFFYDRATGEHIDAAPGVDLGNIVAVATRPIGA